ncbi:hypothetical protein TgHK011_009378 [Trichoderma gracile]|nr:hypothetical protein TgHK011_009378 [Trichoderma gracile]
MSPGSEWLSGGETTMQKTSPFWSNKDIDDRRPCKGHTERPEVVRIGKIAQQQLMTGPVQSRQPSSGTSFSPPVAQPERQSAWTRKVTAAARAVAHISTEASHNEMRARPPQLKDVTDGLGHVPLHHTHAAASAGQSVDEQYCFRWSPSSVPPKRRASVGTYKERLRAATKRPSLIVRDNKGN